jgi:hypothetical protein
MPCRADVEQPRKCGFEMGPSLKNNDFFGSANSYYLAVKNSMPISIEVDRGSRFCADDPSHVIKNIEHLDSCRTVGH